MSTQGGPAQITVLIPLPVSYNADAQGMRRPVEEEKFFETCEELSLKFGGGILHRFINEAPKGFWWNRGVLSRDEQCVFEVDMLDTDEHRRWITAYARGILLGRFRQEAIYLRFIGPVESMVVTEETITE